MHHSVNILTIILRRWTKNRPSIHIVKPLTGLHGISLDEDTMAFQRSSLDLYWISRLTMIKMFLSWIYTPGDRLHIPYSPYFTETNFRNMVYGCTLPCITIYTSFSHINVLVLVCEIQKSAQWYVYRATCIIVQNISKTYHYSLFHPERIFTR